MSEGTDSPEYLWENLLSRQPELIRSAFDSLDPETRRHVLAHLQRMVTEEGWHAEQQASARAALDTLEGSK